MSSLIGLGRKEYLNEWIIDMSSLPVYLTVKTEGMPSVADTTELWNELLASDHWRTGMCIMFDNRAMERFPRRRQRFRDHLVGIEISESCIERIGNARIAVLIGKPENFIYHRQFQYGLALRGIPANTQIFSTKTTRRNGWKPAREHLPHRHTFNLFLLRINPDREGRVGTISLICP